MRAYIFYKASGLLHDITKEDVDLFDSIDPATNQKYEIQTFEDHFFFKVFAEIIGDRDLFKYLADQYPDDLIQGCNEL